MAHDVFISHSSKDKTVADAVCATLEQHHIRCWIAPRDIGPGEEWGEAIVSAIQASRVMVLIFSASANESPQIRREVERAVHNNVVIVPMRIEDVLPQKSLEYFIGAVHWLDAFSKPLEDYLEKLAGVVRGILEGPSASRTPAVAELSTPKKGGRRALFYAAGGIVVLAIIVLGTLVLPRKPASSGEASKEAGSAASMVAARGGLRSKKQSVSVGEAKALVLTHNFFHANWNTGGKGAQHQYQSKAVQGRLVIEDDGTGLVWCGSSEERGEKAAEEYVQELNTKKFGGFDDWRLPTLEEAMSLMTPPEKGQVTEVTDGEHTTKGVDHIDGAFQAMGVSIVWTADAYSATQGWVVYFFDGICDPEDLGFNASVLAVRSLTNGRS